MSYGLCSQRIKKDGTMTVKRCSECGAKHGRRDCNNKNCRIGKHNIQQRLLTSVSLDRRKAIRKHGKQLRQVVKLKQP